ncbi:MAG: MSMEG_0565 family glycosyltransferase [Nodosilinea sp.]
MAERSGLRIALLTYSTKPRGSVLHTLELATALQGLGHSVTVYALDKEGSGFDYPLRCSVYLIPAQPVAGGMDALIQQRIQEFVEFLNPDHLRHQGYDCYHAQDCIGANALLTLRERGLIPHVIRTVHHVEAFTSAYLQVCQDRSIQAPNLCLSVSAASQGEVWQHYGRPAPRVINGLNGDRFSPLPDGTESAIKQQLGLTGQPVYLTLGGIEPRKNSLTLLRAFARVLSHCPRAQLVMAGGATLFDYQSYRDQFFALADDLGITPGRSLLLPGVIADAQLPGLYRSADAFVFPSRQEGWGLVVLEAIASGLPVLTSRQPPFTEFLRPDQALLINPEDAAAIAQGMLQILQPQTARALVEASRSILPHYSWVTSAKMHLDHYRQLL